MVLLVEQSTKVIIRHTKGDNHAIWNPLCRIDMPAPGGGMQLTLCTSIPHPDPPDTSNYNNDAGARLHITGPYSITGDHPADNSICR